MENYLDEYVKSLMEKQNIGADYYQRSLFSEKQYYELLKEVSVLLKEHPDMTVEEYREELFKKEGIENQIRDFVHNKKMTPGLVLSYGTGNHTETLVTGNRQEVVRNESGLLVPAVEEMTEDTIFDIASETKLFTSITILSLTEKGIINLNDYITKYSPEFTNLKDVTIFDLLSFSVPLKTNGRVDRVSTEKEGEEVLKTIEVDQTNPNYNPYTDMGFMVLGRLIEDVTGMKYYEFLDKEILSKILLVDTHVVVPENKIHRVANTNYDVKLNEDGSIAVNDLNPKGITHDPKARVMGQSQGHLSGHAGLFSTSKDLHRFLRAISNKEVINQKNLDEISINRTGRKYIDEEGKLKNTRALGLGTWVKNSDIDQNEVFYGLSGKSFATVGYTGTQGTSDPLNDITTTLVGNRTHNRLISVHPAQKGKVIEIENGEKYIELPDGTRVTDAREFATERDYIIRSMTRLAIQYKFFEDLIGYEKQNIQEENSVKRI